MILSKSVAVELRLAVSVIAALGLQFFSAGAMPLLLGSVTDQLALGASEVGLLGTLELAAMAVAATATAPMARVGSGRSEGAVLSQSTPMAC